MNYYHIPKTLASAHHDIKPYDYTYLTYGEKMHRVTEDASFIYSFNNYGHRSDDFVKNEKKYNILFSGCSVTFGESLPYQQNWSGKLYKKIKNIKDVGNYNNLSFLGGSSEFIIFNIFLYFKEFGNPNVIFLLLPDSSRRVTWNDGSKNYENYVNAQENENGIKMSLLRSLYHVTMLEQYCLSNNIKLFWSSWNEEDCNNFYNHYNFNNFIYLSNYKVLDNSKNNDEKNSLYYMIGRDGVHPGLRYSDGLANIFYNKFIDKDKNEKIN